MDRVAAFVRETKDILVHLSVRRTDLKEDDSKSDCPRINAQALVQSLQ